MFLISEDLPNLSHSSLICTASSRVGAITNTMGPSPGWRYGCHQQNRPGSIVPWLQSTNPKEDKKKTQRRRQPCIAIEQRHPNVGYGREKRIAIPTGTPWRLDAKGPYSSARGIELEKSTMKICRIMPKNLSPTQKNLPREYVHSTRASN